MRWGVRLFVSARSMYLDLPSKNTHTRTQGNQLGSFKSTHVSRYFHLPFYLRLFPYEAMNKCEVYGEFAFSL